MQLEQIRDKAYRDARRRVPNPSFGASIHKYGETDQEVMKSINDMFRDEDEEFLKKYLDHFVENAISEINPLNLLPIAREFSVLTDLLIT